MKKTVAFIGLGNMGSRMARRLVNAGYDLTICDTNDAVLNSFDAKRVSVTKRPVDCASSDVIIVMVADAQQIESVTLGAGGLNEALGKGHCPVIVIMSTTLPSTCTQLQERFGRDRARIVDAPVSGGLFGASEGTLSMMMGGQASDIDEVADVMRVFGPNAFRCGPLGSGETAKIVNNIIGVTNMYGAAEAFEIASRNGLSLEVLGPILEAGSGRNFFSADVTRARGNFAAWAESKEGFESLGDIIRKDLSLAIHLAEDAGMKTPVLRGVSDALAEIPEATRAQWQALG